MRLRSTRPRRTSSSTTGVRLDLSRPLACGIARDQRQRGETARTFADFQRAAGERLERGLLCHAQIEADPMGERAEIERFGKGFAVPAAAASAGAIGSVHFQPHFARRHI